MAVTIDLAISAIRAGRKLEGRQLLNLLIQQNPNNETAWLWMSQVVDTDEQRARCLYHVLALNPENQLARRGLQLLGIVVTDSRPVKLPPDLQTRPPQQNGAPPPQPQAKDKTGDDPRRPFLIDPATITKELPFVPVKPPAPAREPVQASPEILALRVDDEPAPAETETDKAAPSAAETATAAPAPQESAPKQNPVTASTAPAERPQKVRSAEAATMPVVAAAEAVSNSQSPANNAAPAQQPQAESNAVTAGQTIQPPATEPAPTADQKQPAKPADDTATVITQKMPSPFEQPQPQAEQPAPDSAAAPPPQPSDSGPVAPPQQLTPNPIAGPHHHTDIPLETRQSQPVLINYPIPNASLPPDGQVYYPTGQQMPYNHPGAYPNQGYYPAPGQFHNSATMGMPMLPPGHFNRPPSEPVPPIPGGHGLFSGQGMPPGMSLHSNATMMMPTMSEAEARARLATSQAIPTANAAAMPLQNGGSWPYPPGFGPSNYPHDYQAYIGDEEEDEEEGEINILAVIIFGTLSITALGGLGMLVLLIVTTSPSSI